MDMMMIMMRMKIDTPILTMVINWVRGFCDYGDYQESEDGSNYNDDYYGSDEGT